MSNETEISKSLIHIELKKTVLVTDLKHQIQWYCLCLNVYNEMSVWFRIQSQCGASSGQTSGSTKHCGYTMQ